MINDTIKKTLFFKKLQIGTYTLYINITYLLYINKNSNTSCKYACPICKSLLHVVISAFLHVCTNNSFNVLWINCTWLFKIIEVTLDLVTCNE